MAARRQVFRCKVCGHIVEVLNGGGGTLTCCNQPMNLLAENTSDAAQEKHVPVIARTAKGFRVTVGSVAHPMEEKHFIQWIELGTENGTLRRFLKPGEKPEAEFEARPGRVEAREYCNLHGFWKSEAS